MYVYTHVCKCMWHMCVTKCYVCVYVNVCAYMCTYVLHHPPSFDTRIKQTRLNPAEAEVGRKPG